MVEKDVLLVNGKLLVAMGLPWTLEWIYGTLFDETDKKSGFGLFFGYLNIATNAFLVKSYLIVKYPDFVLALTNFPGSFGAHSFSPYKNY